MAALASFMILLSGLYEVILCDLKLSLAVGVGEVSG
jgi:hypothetical protein